ncbi:alpha/beta-hydrolase [Polyplosphaeria fusca]|uniref:Alpha/beta-hydrolase n=1 Tax=Polyplosphaeria fusca TaxID=682080 RepID=A0A9P4RCU3_9PLEO|nr:alpha/beta-hydrolase [Polyplosphaeria fusca]
MPFFQATDNISLFYTLTGDPSNPPFLLLHGFTCDSHDWSWQIPFLAKNFYIIAPDLRGHGRSSAPKDTAYDITSFASDAAALLKHLDIKLPILAMGHSMGAVAISTLAVLHPETVKAFVLLDPPYWRPGADCDERMAAGSEVVDLIAYTQHYMGALAGESMPAWMKTWQSRRIAGTAPHVITGCLEGAFAEGMLGRKEEHGKLVRGKREQPRLAVYTDEGGAEKEKGLGMRRLDRVEVVEGGHWMHQVESERFNVVLGKWLESIKGV